MQAMVRREQTGKTLTALAEPRRRAVLEYFLSDEVDVASYDELVEVLLARDGSPETRRAAIIQLHHVDLPTLEDCDLVEYDPHSETVRYRGSPIVEGTLGGAAEAERESPSGR